MPSFSRPVGPIDRPLIRPSVRTGAPSPRGEGFCTAEWCGLLRGRFKMLSSIVSLENASQIGLSIPEEIAPQPYQRQRSPKRASGSKRAINPGSRGLPLVFFPPTFFKESRAPPPESAGPGGAAPRGLVIAPTTRRVRSTGGPRPPAPPTDGNGFTLWQQTQNTSPTGGGVS